LHAETHGMDSAKFIAVLWSRELAAAKDFPSFKRNSVDTFSAG